jgi:hypothetical protein
MKFQFDRPPLLTALQEEFSNSYPFLKIAFLETLNRNAMNSISRNPGSRDKETAQAGEVYSSENRMLEQQRIRRSARDLLRQELGVSGSMQVIELEKLLETYFGLPARILRKSGNLWIETLYSKQWTLRQQNDHGEDIVF